MAVSESYRKIWDQAALIPPGQVASYGQIAKQAGLPRRAARMVSRAVGAAPKELELPWFRIVNAQGRISIPRTSSGYERQIALLIAEGVDVVDGQLDMEKHRWNPTLDELMWGPSMFSDMSGDGQE